jgi:hypothetical protein
MKFFFLNRRLQFEKENNMITDIIFAGVGFIVGAFTPAVGRKIKALWVKDTTAAIASAPVAVKTVVATVEAAAKKV